MHASWKLMNLCGSVWNLLNQKIVKITSRRKDTFRYVPQFVEQFSDASRDENSGCESSSGRRMGEARKVAYLAIDQCEEQKRRSFWKHKKSVEQSMLSTLMDMCHRKNAELEPKYHKCKGRVVLGGDTVKDDSGSYSVFIEQGSSASQMTAANAMDVSARRPDCAGQAADAVSACTQVRMEDAPIFSIKNRKSECPDVSVRPRHKWPKSLSNVENLVVPLERNLYGHPLAGLLVAETI